MSDKPTGVFVRLPLSEEAASVMRNHIMSQILTTDALAHTLLAIGTPVTGGDLDVFDIVDAAYGDPSAKYVRQSDAQAQIAVLEAEVVRLREALEEIELGIDALSSEEYDGGRMTSSEMKRQALEVIRSEVKALKGGTA